MTVTIPYGQHATVTGTVGAGKSFYIQNAMAPVYDRLVVVDSEQDDWPWLPNVSVKSAIRLSRSNYSFYVRVPTEGARELDEATIEALCSGILKNGHHECLVLEEATDYSDASYIPTYLRSLMRRARHREVTVIASTQRPQELSRDYYSLAQHHFFFYLSPADISAPSLKRYAPFLQARIREINYKSFRCLYEDVEGNVRVLPPTTKYAWGKRLKRR